MKNKKKYFYLMVICINLFLLIFIMLLTERHLKFSNLKIRSETIKKETNRKQVDDRILIKKAKQENFYPIVQPWMFRKYSKLNDMVVDVPPLGGKPFRKNYMCNEGYGLVRYTSDRFGFRNEDYIWSNISNLKNKILFIGDSFGAGACVNENDTIANNINGKVYNLSMSGNDPYMYNSVLKVFGEFVKPKHIIIVIYSNDFIIYKNDIYDNKKITKNKYICNNYLCNDILNITNQAENFLLKENIDFGKRPDFLSRLKVYLTFPIIREKVVFIKEKYFFHSITPIMKELVNNSKEYCIKLSCKLNFIYIPNNRSYRPDPMAKINKALLFDLLEENKISYIDMSEIFNEYDEKLIYPLSGSHLNPNGYKLIAREINKKIIN